MKYRSITTGCEKKCLEKYTHSNHTSVELTSVELTDLYPNIEYEIEVSARTVNYGNASVIRRRTETDRKWYIPNIKLYFFYSTLKFWSYIEVLRCLLYKFASVKLDLTDSITNQGRYVRRTDLS